MVTSSIGAHLAWLAAAPATDEDRPVQDDGWPDVAPGLAGRWTVTPSRRKLAAAVSGVALVLSAGLAVRASGAERTTEVRTLTAAAPSVAPTLDASGCPAGVSCLVTATPIAEQISAVRSQFPRATLMSAVVTRDASTGHVYRSELSYLLRNSDTMTIWAQSVPGLPTSRDDTTVEPRRRVTLAGDVVVQSWLEIVRRPTGDGSSVTVQTQTNGSVRYAETGVKALAAAAGLRLP